MRCALLLLLLLAAASAKATTVFKCTAADGTVGFQDHPCDAHVRQQRLQLQDAAPASAAPAEASAAATSATAPVAAPVATAPPPPRPPAPDAYLCTRYDGSRYLSEDGVGVRRAVPYAMLGGSGMSLAEAYGGRDGIGVSAPGLRRAPDLPATQNPLAGAYVWVDDQCLRVAPQEACAYLHGELDRVEGQLRRAFSDTEAQLRQEAQTLRERLRGC